MLHVTLRKRPGVLLAGQGHVEGGERAYVQNGQRDADEKPVAIHGLLLARPVSLTPRQGHRKLVGRAPPRLDIDQLCQTKRMSGPCVTIVSASGWRCRARADGQAAESLRTG